MYDNSGTLALTGSGVMILGDTAGVAALAAAGVFVLVIALALKLTAGRPKRGI